MALYRGDGGAPTSFGTSDCRYSTNSRTGLQYRGPLSRPHRLTTPRTTRPSTLAAGSRVRTSLQQGGQLTRPHRLTMPQPTHLFMPPLMLRSSLPSVSRGMVYINISGRTCLDELFIDYEQVTTWEARFSCNKLEANYHILSAVVCTGWFNGQAHESPPLQFG